MKDALIDLGVDSAPLEFLIVGDEVFHRGDDALALNALDVRHRHSGGQIRIFTKALEVSAAVRSTLNVHARRQHHIYVQRSRLLANGPSDLLNEAGIPCGCQRDTGWESSCGNRRIVQYSGKPTQTVGVTGIVRFQSVDGMAALVGV